MPLFWFFPSQIVLVKKIKAQTNVNKSGGHYFSCIVLTCADLEKIVWGQFEANWWCCNFFYKGGLFSRTSILEKLNW